MSRRIKVSDLCYSCRQLYTTEGGSVEEILNAYYAAPDGLSEKRACLALIRAIVKGDGCTTCGAKVLDWSKDFM